MTENFTAYTDEQGRLIVPPHIARALGLTPNTEVQIEKDDSGLRLRPSVTALRKVYIEITNLCNLNCSTCMRNVWDAEFGRMSEDTFEQVLTGIQAFSPQPEIFFGGYGEPLSHPGCLTMLRRAKELGLRVSLITNGILLTEAVSRQLIDMGLDMLWVSLDGASPECYTDVRLGNALPTILDNLKTMRYLQYSQFGLSPWAMSPRLGIAFVAMQRNIRDLPEFAEDEGRIRVPLRFEPMQSWFVVFRDRDHLAPRDAGPKNFPSWSETATVTGPWQVSFDPKWGGLAKPVTWTELTDWSKHPDPRVHYYSGTAVYRTTFPAEIPDRKSTILLDLGAVEVMARVRLNGQDCGIAWKPPYRVDISGAARGTE